MKRLSDYTYEEFINFLKLEDYEIKLYWDIDDRNTEQ